MSKDVFDASGDLGMGRGLKPGSMNDLDFAIKLEQALNLSANSHFTLPPMIMSPPPPPTNSLPFRHLNGFNRNNGSLFKKRPIHSSELEESRIEIEALSHELDSVLKQLHSKQQAIKIFQQQIMYSRLENERLESKLKWFHDTLIRDFNSLQFKVEQEREAMNESRTAYEDQIKRLEEENQALKLYSDKQDKTIKESNLVEKQTTLKDILASIMCDEGEGGSTDGADDPAKFQFGAIQQLPEKLDCNCFSLELRRCVCAKTADRLIKQLKQASLNQVRCPKCLFKHSSLQYGQSIVPEHPFPLQIPFRKEGPEMNGKRMLHPKKFKKINLNSSFNWHSQNKVIK